MATGFIASAINLNTTLQDHLTCSIHRGLLSHPMMVPCKGKHRLCKECITDLIGTQRQINCPECREPCAVPPNWTTDWFDRVVNDVTTMLATSEKDVNEKINKFVQESYHRFGTENGRLLIKSVQLVSNPRLKDAFERFKNSIHAPEVVTLLHGTERKAALSISGQGFRIPTSFDRDPRNPNEGEQKFGKAIYFSQGKKATEYGQNALILSDVILGRVQRTDMSELKLTPEIMQQRGYDTIHYNNSNEGLVNQEWVVYKTEQCYPLCIIDYEIQDENSASEQELVEKITKMSYISPDWNTLGKALVGTDNQCKEALRFIGNAGSKGTTHANELTTFLLQSLSKHQVNSLLKRPNETVRILFLRALWRNGRHDLSLQKSIHQTLDWSILVESLHSSYADVSWRACGVIANIAAVIAGVRDSLVTPPVLNQLMSLLKRAVQFTDKICILTVLNLLANIAVSQHDIMKDKNDILKYINDYLLDHCDEEIKEAGNRVFCNIIGKGVVSADWQRGGFVPLATTPTIQ